MSVSGSAFVRKQASFSPQPGQGILSSTAQRSNRSFTHDEPDLAPVSRRSPCENAPASTHNRNAPIFHLSSPHCPHSVLLSGGTLQMEPAPHGSRPRIQDPSHYPPAPRDVHHAKPATTPREQGPPRAADGGHPPRDLGGDLPRTWASHRTQADTQPRGLAGTPAPEPAPAMVGNPHVTRGGNCAQRARLRDRARRQPVGRVVQVKPM